MLFASFFATLRSKSKDYTQPQQHRPSSTQPMAERPQPKRSSMATKTASKIPQATTTTQEKRRSRRLSLARPKSQQGLNARYHNSWFGGRPDEDDHDTPILPQAIPITYLDAKSRRQTWFSSKPPHVQITVAEIRSSSSPRRRPTTASLPAEKKRPTRRASSTTLNSNKSSSTTNRSSTITLPALPMTPKAASRPFWSSSNPDFAHPPAPPRTCRLPPLPAQRPAYKPRSAAAGFLATTTSPAAYELRGGLRGSYHHLRRQSGVESEREGLRTGQRQVDADVDVRGLERAKQTNAEALAALEFGLKVG